MNKNELVALISDLSGLTKTDSTKALDGFIKAVEKTLKNDDEIRLVGFGTFSVTKREATTGRNPRTGLPIKIAASKRPRFKPGKVLIDALN